MCGAREKLVFPGFVTAQICRITHCVVVFEHLAHSAFDLAICW